MLIVLLIVLIASYLSYKLATTTPAMYNSVGLAQPVIIAKPGEEYETVVYTSTRPANWNIFLFDSMDALTGLFFSYQNSKPVRQFNR